MRQNCWDTVLYGLSWAPLDHNNYEKSMMHGRDRLKGTASHALIWMQIDHSNVRQQPPGGGGGGDGCDLTWCVKDVAARACMRRCKHPAVVLQCLAPVDNACPSVIDLGPHAQLSTRITWANSMLQIRHLQEKTLSIRRRLATTWLQPRRLEIISSE